MICRRCLSQLARARPHQHALQRTFTSYAARSAAAEPFATPAAMSPSARGEVRAGKKAAAASSAASTVPAGTVLKGLNYLKEKQDPVAMEDAEYPPWLWTVLDEVKGQGKAINTKKATKKRVKTSQKLGTLEETVPIHHQSIDLPVSDGTAESITYAMNASKNITKAMRGDRRAKIKEDNFLRTMK